MTSAHLTALRDLLHAPPDPQVWGRVVALLDALTSPDDLAFAIDYARHHLDAAWPPHLRTLPPTGSAPTTPASPW